jgi:hypothetical protein
MSVNYADGLSPYEHKGPCGQPELQDTEEEVDRKITELVELITDSRYYYIPHCYRGGIITFKTHEFEQVLLFAKKSKVEFLCL